MKTIEFKIRWRYEGRVWIMEFHGLPTELHYFGSYVSGWSKQQCISKLQNLLKIANLNAEVTEIKYVGEDVVTCDTIEVKVA